MTTPTLDELLTDALIRRQDLLARLGSETTCVRLLHGATEGAPGVAIDRYGPVLLVQTWREHLGPGVLDALVGVANQALETDLIGVWNHRAKGAPPYEETAPIALPDDLTGRELGLCYDVQPRHRGKDPLLFLDFRGARRLVREQAKGRTVCNTFAYTCGIGIAALAGGATDVLNVDFAASALDVGRTNARLNGLQDRFQVLQEDCIPVLRRLAGLPVKPRKGRGLKVPRIAARQFDLVVMDPPRWATSRWGAVDLVNDYQSLFKPALLATASGGHLLVTNNVASVDERAWVDVLQRCATKAGRPLRSLDLVRPDSDFPSPDGQPPLKVALIAV